jgi:hypothetical protein
MSASRAAPRVRQKSWQLWQRFVKKKIDQLHRVWPDRGIEEGNWRSTVTRTILTVGERHKLY